MSQEPLTGAFKRQLQVGLALISCVFLGLVVQASSIWLAGLLGLLCASPLVFVLNSQMLALSRVRISAQSLFIIALLLVLTCDFKLSAMLGPVLVAQFLLLARKQALVLAVITLSGVSVAELAILELSVLSFETLSQVVSYLLLILVLNMLFRQIAKQQERLEAAQRIDPLTGLENRQALVAELKQLYRLHERYSRRANVIRFTLKGAVTALPEHDFEVFCKDLSCLMQSRIRISDQLFRPQRDQIVLILHATDGLSAESLVDDLLNCARVYQFTGAPDFELCPCSFDVTSDESEDVWIAQVLNGDGSVS